MLGRVVGPEAGVDEAVDDRFQGRGVVVRVTAAGVSDGELELDEPTADGAGRRAAGELLEGRGYAWRSSSGQARRMTRQRCR